MYVCLYVCMYVCMVRHCVAVFFSVNIVLLLMLLYAMVSIYYLNRSVIEKYAPTCLSHSTTSMFCQGQYLYSDGSRSDTNVIMDLNYMDGKNKVMVQWHTGL